MRKFTIAALLTVFAVTLGSAQEFSSLWGRRILIGYDAENYYCLCYEAVQEGSNLEYYERIFWGKYTNSGVPIERKLIREVRHYFDEDQKTWASTETLDAPVNIVEVLMENGASPAFPINLNEKAFFIKMDGVHYNNGHEDALIISSDRIAEYIREYSSWTGYEDYSEDSFSIAGIYSSASTVFVVLQYGGKGHEYALKCFKSGECRHNLPNRLSYQVIIPTPMSDFPRLRDLVIHKVRSGENLSKIAQKYGVTVQQVMSWNKLKNPDHVFIGQKLKIYK